MAALNFPSSPADGDKYQLNGIVYYWNATVGAWMTWVVQKPLDGNTSDTQLIFNDGGYSNGSYGMVFLKAANTVYFNNTAATVNASAGWFNGNAAFETQRSGNSYITTGTIITANITGNLGFSKVASVAIDVSNRTDAILLPMGTTAQRPTGANGMFRYNSTISRFEGYRDTAWGSLGGATGGGTDDAFYENTTTVTTDYTITTGKNAMTAGPVTINSGVTVTVPSGSVWTVV